MPENLSVRSISVCGDRIRYFRVLRGLTQEQLARISGYSDRLIRKAEAGEKLSKAAILDIANALSSEERKVTINELLASPINVVRQFLESYDLYYHEMLSHISQILADDFSLHNAGDPNRNLVGIMEAKR